MTLQEYEQNLKAEQRRVHIAHLRFGILRYIKSGRGIRFQDQVRDNFFSYSDADFGAVIEEMVSSGVLERIRGPRGGISLQLYGTSQVDQKQEAANGN